MLVPLDDGDGLLTVPFGGLDWICAFTDEDALARFAPARDEAGREWTYRRVTGALLLDEVVPAAGDPFADASAYPRTPPEQRTPQARARRLNARGCVVASAAQIAGGEASSPLP